MRYTLRREGIHEKISIKYRIRLRLMSNFKVFTSHPIIYLPFLIPNGFGLGWRYLKSGPWAVWTFFDQDYPADTTLSPKRHAAAVFLNHWTQLRIGQSPWFEMLASHCVWRLSFGTPTKKLDISDLDAFRYHSCLPRRVVIRFLSNVWF